MEEGGERQKWEHRPRLYPFQVGHCLAPASGRLSAYGLPTAWGRGRWGATHIAFIVYHLDLPRVAKLHHRPDGYIKLLSGSQVHPDIVPLWVRESAKTGEQGRGSAPLPGSPGPSCYHQ